MAMGVPVPSVSTNSPGARCHRAMGCRSTIRTWSVSGRRRETTASLTQGRLSMASRAACTSSVRMGSPRVTFRACRMAVPEVRFRPSTSRLWTDSPAFAEMLTIPLDAWASFWSRTPAPTAQAPLPDSTTSPTARPAILGSGIRRRRGVRRAAFFFDAPRVCPAKGGKRMVRLKSRIGLSPPSSDTTRGT